MKEVLTMTDLAQLRACASSDATKSQLLIVVSRDCPWCVKFKDLWEEIDQQIAHAYTVFIVDVTNVGGEALFAKGAQLFLPLPVELPMGFPTLYRLTSIDEIEIVNPHVFWDFEAFEFLQSNLVSYLLNAEGP